MFKTQKEANKHFNRLRKQIRKSFNGAVEDFLLLLHLCSIPHCDAEDNYCMALDEELRVRGVLTDKGISLEPLDDVLLEIFIENAQEARANLNRILRFARSEQKLRAKKAQVKA